MKIEMPLVEGQNITVKFGRKNPVTAVDSASLKVFKGQSVAIVGESGSGKSTLIKALFGLETIFSGKAFFDGKEVMSKGRALWLRKRTGMVFQDPYSSLDPRMTIADSVAEPLKAMKIPGDHQKMVSEMLRRLEIPEDAECRYPASFSGGQRQRIAIARALVHGPEALVGDEPVSALDVLVRGRIIEMLKELREQMGLTMITVTHDLAVVPDLAERVIVLKNGVILEDGPTEQIFSDPQHEYTKSLITALPRLPKK